MQPRVLRFPAHPIFFAIAVVSLLTPGPVQRVAPQGAIGPSQQFAAAADDGLGTPPDPQGAAGPDHLLAMTNTRFTAQTKDGAIVATWTPSQFWAPVALGDDLFDPRVMFDSLSGRWIAVMVTVGTTAAPALLLAVSDGTDPTQGWKYQRIAADPHGQDYAEFPLIGGNARWICVTANLISTTSGLVAGGVVWVIEKTPLVTSNSLSVTRFPIVTHGSPYAPVVTFDSDQPDELLVEQRVGGSQPIQLDVKRVTDVGGHPALSDVGLVTAPVAWLDDPVPLDSLPQAGTARRITSSQDDIASACLRHGIIWAVQTATIPAGAAPMHTAVQWWRLTPAGTLSAFGRIEDPEGLTWLGYPSVAVNARDQVLIGYSVFSPTTFASAGYSFRPADGCDGALSEIHLLRSGDAPYTRLDGSGLNRWGDLSETVVDPSDDLSMWTIQEYAAEIVGGQSRWGTWWAGFSPAMPGRDAGCVEPGATIPLAPVTARAAVGPAAQPR